MSISYELRARVALDKNGFRNTHSLGQNFILDQSLMEHLLDLACVGCEDRVLEIGPGPGLLTALMARRCRKVTSIEIDEKLKPVLDEVLADCENANIIFGDAMRLDIGKIVAESMGEGPFRVVANLPYYITTDVLMRLVASGLDVKDICVMVQKEAAERMMSLPGGKKWCAVAATIDYFGSPEELCEVPRAAFDPPPHVDSAFIRINMYDKKPVQAKDDAMMLKVINAAFHMRRKKLTNNLKAVFSISQDAALAALSAAGIDANIRGEALEIAELARLSDVLSEMLG